MDIHLEGIGVGEPADIDGAQLRYEPGPEPEKPGARTTAQPFHATAQDHIGAERLHRKGHDAGGLGDIDDRPDPPLGAQSRDFRHWSHGPCVGMHVRDQGPVDVRRQGLGPGLQGGGIGRLRNQPKFVAQSLREPQDIAERGEGLFRRDPDVFPRRGSRQGRQQLGQRRRKIGLRAVFGVAPAEQGGQCAAELIDGAQPGRPRFAPLLNPWVEEIRLEGGQGCARHRTDGVRQQIRSRPWHLKGLRAGQRRTARGCARARQSARTRRCAR